MFLVSSGHIKELVCRGMKMSIAKKMQNVPDSYPTWWGDYPAGSKRKDLLCPTVYGVEVH